MTGLLVVPKSSGCPLLFSKIIYLFAYLDHMGLFMGLHFRYNQEERFVGEVEQSAQNEEHQ